MSIAFPFIVEYESDQFVSGVAHNSCTDMSESGAQDLYWLLKESPRVRYARYWKTGEEGNRAEYYRE